jgi:hypothetical protein
MDQEHADAAPLSMARRRGRQRPEQGETLISLLHKRSWWGCSCHGWAAGTQPWSAFCELGLVSPKRRR